MAQDGEPQQHPSKEKRNALSQQWMSLVGQDSFLALRTGLDPFEFFFVPGSVGFGP